MFILINVTSVLCACDTNFDGAAKSDGRLGHLGQNDLSPLSEAVIAQIQSICTKMIRHPLSGPQVNLKMRKYAVIVAIIIISSLNVAIKPSLSHHYHYPNDEKLLISTFVPGGVRGAPSESAEIETAKRTIDSFEGDVKIENIPSLNKADQLTAAGDYQPSVCQLVQIVHVLKHPGCQSKAIASYACTGSCTSSVRVSIE